MNVATKRCRSREGLKPFSINQVTKVTVAIVRLPAMNAATYATVARQGVMRGSTCCGIRSIPARMLQISRRLHHKVNRSDRSDTRRSGFGLLPAIIGRTRAHSYCIVTSANSRGRPSRFDPKRPYDWTRINDRKLVYSGRRGQTCPACDVVSANFRFRIKLSARDFTCKSSGRDQRSLNTPCNLHAPAVGGRTSLLRDRPQSRPGITARTSPRGPSGGDCAGIKAATWFQLAPFPSSP